MAIEILKILHYGRVATQIVLEHADVTKKIEPGKKKFVKLIMFSVSSTPFIPMSSVINGVTCNSAESDSGIRIQATLSVRIRPLCAIVRC